MPAAVITAMPARAGKAGLTAARGWMAELGFASAAGMRAAMSWGRSRDRGAHARANRPRTLERHSAA